jgi:hypothetical protein
MNDTPIPRARRAVGRLQKKFEKADPKVDDLRLSRNRIRYIFVCAHSRHLRARQSRRAEHGSTPDPAHDRRHTHDRTRRARAAPEDACSGTGDARVGRSASECTPPRPGRRERPAPRARTDATRAQDVSPDPHHAESTMDTPFAGSLRSSTSNELSLLETLPVKVGSWSSP